VSYIVFTIEKRKGYLPSNVLKQDRENYLLREEEKIAFNLAFF